MRDDREEKPTNYEDSEYHFSDDDISYEAEPQSKATAVPVEKPSILSKMPQSKRLLAAIIIFLILVFIVYRMVMPSNSVPATDITSVPLATPVVTPARPITNTTAQVPAQPAATEQSVTLPATMPVANKLSDSSTNAVSQQSTMNDAARALSLQTEQLINQFSANYNQKINDALADNKKMQDEMQVLTTRVSTLEAQLGQLIQVLTAQMQNTKKAAPAPTPAPERQISTRYSVQAIIPGRAWLRSDNGESLTVTEGDAIKDLGRVTKIDPYDGIVEINTGSKTISLSYGSGN